MNTDNVILEDDAIELNTRIDAVTITSSITGDRTKSKFFVRSAAMTVDDMFFAYEESKPLVSNGARGWAKGSLRFLQKYNRQDSTKVDWVLMGVTGVHSQEVYKLCLSYDEPFKVTRLDIAIDVEFATSKPDYLMAIYNTHRQWDKSLRLVSSPTGDTLYRGSRKSSKFGRVYDKSVAYGLETGKVYRFEIEVKKLDAVALNELLARSNDITHDVRNVAIKTWKNWHIPIPAQGGRVVTPRVQALISNDTQKLEWLSGISRAIRSLCERGYEPQVREILNLPGGALCPRCEDEDERDRLANNSQYYLVHCE